MPRARRPVSSPQLACLVSVSEVDHVSTFTISILTPKGGYAGEKEGIWKKSSEVFESLGDDPSAYIREKNMSASVKLTERMLLNTISSEQLPSIINSLAVITSHISNHKFIRVGFE
jgi:hypothetical protein